VVIPLVQIGKLVKEHRVTLRVAVTDGPLAMMTNSQLIERAILNDDEQAAVAGSIVAQQLKVRWRSRHILEPSKGQLHPLQWLPPAVLDRVQKCVGERLRYQRSSQISVLIIAMSAPAPAAATPLRNDSFLDTREKKLVSF
jgi:hypothetical protein